jgi:hypothetical protein
MNKKAISEEGAKSLFDNLKIMIIFLAVLVIALLILAPKLTSQAAGETTSNFGKYIWDMLTGGK